MVEVVVVVVVVVVGGDVIVRLGIILNFFLLVGLTFFCEIKILLLFLAFLSTNYIVFHIPSSSAMPLVFV